MTDAVRAVTGSATMDHMWMVDFSIPGAARDLVRQLEADAMRRIKGNRTVLVGVLNPPTGSHCWDCAG